MYYYLECKSQHTFQSLKEAEMRKSAEKEKVTEEALVKLMKITVFLVKHHWAHTYNYEDFVNFIAIDLNDQVLGAYLKLSASHRNATYLSANTVSQFVKVISDWMKEQTIKELKEIMQFSLLLDEQIDQSYP